MLSILVGLSLSAVPASDAPWANADGCHRCTLLAYDDAMPRDEVEDRIRKIDIQRGEVDDAWPPGARALAWSSAISGIVLIGGGVALDVVDSHTTTDFHILGAVGVLSIVLGVLVAGSLLLAGAIYGHAHASSAEEERERLSRERRRLEEDLRTSG